METRANPKPIQMAVSTLKRNGAKYNPRVMDDESRESLERSIRNFGVVQTVVYNRKTSTVVGGHQTIEAAIKKGLTKLWVMPVSISEMEEKALNLALNRIDGQWVWEDVRSILQEMNEIDTDLLELTGFPEFEIAPLLSEGYTPPALDDLNSSDPTALMLTFDKEQAAIVKQAIAKVRERGDPELKRAECLTQICRSYLGG